MASKDHIVHDLVMLCALVRSDRLAVVGYVIHSETAIKADLPVTRIRAVPGVEFVYVWI